MTGSLTPRRSSDSLVMRSIKHNSLDGYSRLRAGAGDTRGEGGGSLGRMITREIGGGGAAPAPGGGGGGGGGCEPGAAGGGGAAEGGGGNVGTPPPHRISRV